MTIDLIFVTILLLVLAVSFLSYFPLMLLIAARAAGVQSVTPSALIGMRLRRVPPDAVVIPLIAASKRGVNLDVSQLEAHFLAGGNNQRVVQALIRAKQAQEPLTFDQAAAMDLSRPNTQEAVKMFGN